MIFISNKKYRLSDKSQRHEQNIQTFNEHFSNILNCSEHILINKLENEQFGLGQGHMSNILRLKNIKQIS